MEDVQMVEDPLALDVNWGTIRKLEYLGDYLTAYCRATRSISDHGGQVAYLDPFAGSGYVRDEDGLIHPGSAAIALELHPQFNSFGFADADPNHASALSSVVNNANATSYATVVEGDANRVISQLLSAVPTRGGAGFAFVDPPGLQARWSLLETIANHRSQKN